MIRKRRIRLLAFLMILSMLCTMLPTAALATEDPSGVEATLTEVTYSVTVDSAITGGSIAMSPTSGPEGTEVTVTVTPDNGKQLVAGSLQYAPQGGSAIGIVDSGYSFIIPAADVVVTARFEDIASIYFNITMAPVPDPIWMVTADKTSAAAGETITVTVSDTAFTSWATGLIVTGDSGTTYDFTTITEATGNANNVNGPGVYSFVMPGEPVTVGFTADHTPLNVYIQYGTAGEEIPVHSYTRAEMEALATENTAPIHYAMYDRLPAVFMGKAVRYVTIGQLAASAANYNSAVRFDGPDCSLRGASLDGWTLGVNGLNWEYLMGQTRKYYAGIGDQYLAEENRTGLDREVPAVLAITGWAGRRTQVDNQPYDTLNTYRFFYGQTEAEYGNGVLPTLAERDARCTAMNTSKFVNKVVFVVPETVPATYNVTADSAITGGSLKISPASAAAGDTITVTVTPDSGKQLVAGSLKYTADSGVSYTEITATEGVYSFVMPAADTVVTARFADPAATVTSVSLDKTTLDITVGSFEQLTAIVTPAGAGNQEVTWASDNAATATVNSNGLVRAARTGSANITVTTVDGGFTATCAVTVQPAGEDHFTIAVLPDTQFYAESYPEIFAQQTQWVVNHADSQNIVFVAHLGDIQDDFDNPVQWQNARDAMAAIRAAGIPYALAPGNHDLNFTAGDPTNFDAYFPYTDFSDYSWYGGHYPANSNTSSYQFFSAMGQDFIVLNLVCTPALLADATDWANTVLTQYSGRKAIVVTHGYIKPNGEYAGGDDVSGPAIHENIVKKHGNVIAVLCGHISGQYHGTDTGDSGNTVYNLLTDYTNLENGGNGWLRLYQFYPLSNTLQAVTCSPYLEQYDTSAAGQFQLPLVARFTVTVDSSISGGTVAVNPAGAAAGDTVNVTVTPDEGKRLVAGSLKYTADGGAAYTEITATGGLYSFVLPAASVVVSAQFEDIPATSTVWDGSIDVTWYNTTDTVFYIDTPAKLAGLAAIVNGIYNTGAAVTGNPSYIVTNVGGGDVAGPTDATWIYGADDFDGKTVCLTVDLDMGGVYDSAAQTWSGPNYMPIGGQYCMTALDGTTLIGSSWNGTFDGRGHTVSNIYCSRHAGSLGYGFGQSVGLIGRMGVHDNDPLDWYATPFIKNVAVTGYIYANRSVGGIVGKNGRSNGSMIENCINYASVRNTDSKGVGGIAGAGWNNLTIKNCANLGEIYTSYSNAGGISGSCEATVINCYNVGYVGASSANQAQSLGTNNGGAVWTNCYWLDGSSASNQAVYNSTTGSTITKMDTPESMKTADFLSALNGDSRAWVEDTGNINSGYPVPHAWSDTATLTSITKESDPARLSYVEGETFDPAGLVIWANYSDGTRERITSYTISKTAPLGATDTSITVSGNYSGTVYSYDFTITVTDNPLQSITITTPPTNLLYAAGESFDPAGMVIIVTYADGETANLAAGQYTVTPSAFAPGDDKATISYTSSGVTVTADQPVTVLATDAPALVDGFYELSSADHMLWFANRVNVGRRASTKGKLTDNIDLSAVTWTPIGASTTAFYSGAFEGNGKTVTLAMEGFTDFAGLFGYIQDGAIKDLTLAGIVSGSGTTAGVVVNAMGSSQIRNCVNNATVTSTGAGNLVGGIVAGATDTVTISGCVNNGDISNASFYAGGITGYISGAVTVTGCANNGSVSGGYNVGGIIGNDNGSSIVNNCRNTGAVTATSTDTTAAYSVGGIVGYAKYAGTIDQCANSGAVSGGVMNVGGVAGYLNDASALLTNSYNTGSVTSTGTSASANTGGVAGRSNITAGAVRNTYNAGMITVSNSGEFNAGVVGYAKANTNIKDSYYLSTTAAKGLGNAADNTVGKTSDEMKSAEFLAALNGDERIWVADTANTNNGYPVLRVQTADTSNLTGISKESDPARLSYVEGETFDPTGLAIWANYSDGTREKITDYTISKTTPLELTDSGATITVSGAHNGAGFSYDFPITVEANALASIDVTSPPNDLVYIAGEAFDPSGMVVIAIYTNGTTATLTSEQYTISPSVLSTGDTAITISYTEAGVTKTVAQPVTVLAAAPNMDSDNVYELSTADEMLWFANQVNTGTNNAIKGRLLNDIDLTQIAWTPIGTSSSLSYGGIFDGNYKTVTLSAANESSNYVGLFGYVKSADIKDLTVAGSVAGKSYVGGIAGSAVDTNFENCANNATVTGISYRVGGIAGNTSGSTAITGCANNGSVTGEYNVGGIVGYHNSGGTISNCANTGNVTATSASTASGYSVGGVAGYLYAASTLDQCYNSGAVRGGVMNVGGVAGYLNNAATKLTNSYNTGSVTSETTGSARTGGVAGYTNNAACTVQNTYNAGVITVNNTDAYTAGVVGYAKGNTNISNNYYLSTIATKGLGNAADNAVSKTSAELKSAAFAALLGEAYIMQSDAYPILAWQGGAAPVSYSVTVDSAISGGSIGVSSTSAAAGETITVNVTPNSGKQLVAGSLKYNDGAGDTEITATEGVYSFVLPAANVVVTAQFEDISQAPKYTVTPVEDVSVYEVGETGGISAMTVKTGVTGLKYFGTLITPVIEHEGKEAVVFVHLRNGVQLSINVTRADFDLVGDAQSGFNVEAGDVVKVFIVDNLTNDTNFNPTILQ